MRREQAIEHLVASLEQLGAPHWLPPDWVLLQDLDALKDIPKRSRLSHLLSAKAEALRADVQSRIDEIAAAIEDEDLLMAETCLSAFREDIKNYKDLSEKQRTRWVRKAELAMSASPRDLVYFVSFDQLRVKIGYTSNLTARLRSLQTALPTPLQVLLTIPGTLEIERDLHKRFAEHRLDGEWFELSPAIKTFIQSYSSDLS